MKKLFILIISLVFFLPQSSFAQGCMEPSGEDGVQVIGFIQPQFQYDFLGQDANGDPLDLSSFYFNRARLGVMGTIPYDFSYYAMMEFGANLNGARTSTQPFLLDAFITYNRFAPFAKVSVGQFKAPFGLELMQACHKLNTIFRSEAVINLVGPWRDVGVMISGSTGDKIKGLPNDFIFLQRYQQNLKSIIGYNFAVLNGSGINRWDDNNKKEIVGRVTVRPLDFLTVGASYRFGKNPIESSDPNLTESEKQRFGFDAAFDYKGFMVQAEFVQGTDEGAIPSAGGCGGEITYTPGSVERNGYFIQAAYMTPWKLQPIFRFEKYDPDLDQSASDFFVITDETRTHVNYNVLTYGLNYFFNDKVRLQINYLYRAEEDARFEFNNDALVTQFQIVF